MTKAFSSAVLLLGLTCAYLLVLPGFALRAQDKQEDRFRSPRATVGTLLTAITLARLESRLLIQDAAACLDLSGLPAKQHNTAGLLATQLDAVLQAKNIDTNLIIDTRSTPNRHLSLGPGRG